MKRIMQIKYVTKRKNSDNYYFKFNIPEDCRDKLDGKPQIWKSLKTKDLAVAEVDATKLGRMWNEKIASIRVEALGPSVIVTHPKKLEEIADHVRSYISPFIERRINNNIGKPKQTLREILYTKIAPGLDAYQNCL
jgi:hypothetical protein